MVNVASVDTLNNELPWVAEASYDIHRLFVDAVRHEVFSESAVVTIRHFLVRICIWLLLGYTPTIVQILYIHKVDVSIFVSVALVPRYQASKNFLSEESRTYSQILFFIFEVAELTCFFLHILNPRMVEHLWDTYAQVSVKNKHLPDQVFYLC